ncbi:MAG: phosphoglycerate dehydrogenase [Gammaproteobacteria bacterium]|nr:phosphoglycerate dehydrogenase [Gammaproteobacteria bacterium]
MKPNILFNSHLDSPDEWRTALTKHFDDFEFSAAGEAEKPEDVNIAIVWTIPDGGLHRFVNLRAILSLGAGINQLDPSRLPAHVPLARLVDSSLTRTMVDYAKTAVYRYHRRFHEFERLSRRSEWKFIQPTLTRETSVGLLGLGELGREMAGALRREGFAVRGWSRTPKQLDDIQTYTGRDGLASLVATSDIIVNVLPLTDDTRHILDRELFSHCRKGTCLVNMGRGLHLVEADLLKALDDKIIADATLDVTTVEPIPPAHPFWNHPHILITPHVAGLSLPETASIAIAENIRRALAGERLLNQVDLVRGY